MHDVHGEYERFAFGGLTGRPPDSDRQQAGRTLPLLRIRQVLLGRSQVMGSYSVWHWLIVLGPLVVAALIFIIVHRKKR
jgi:hypothetical protein